jgi:hypothetical protein
MALDSSPSLWILSKSRNMALKEKRKQKKT